MKKRFSFCDTHPYKISIEFRFKKVIQGNIKQNFFHRANETLKIHIEKFVNLTSALLISPYTSNWKILFSIIWQMQLSQLGLDQLGLELLEIAFNNLFGNWEFQRIHLALLLLKKYLQKP